MESTDVQTAVPAVPGWLSGRRGLIIVAMVIAASVALTVGQHWLAIGDLLPLLFVLPCAVMMLNCMKGTKRGPQTGTTRTSAPSDAPMAIDGRN